MPSPAAATTACKSLDHRPARRLNTTPQVEAIRATIAATDEFIAALSRIPLIEVGITSMVDAADGIDHAHAFRRDLLATLDTLTCLPFKPRHVSNDAWAFRQACGARA